MPRKKRMPSVKEAQRSVSSAKTGHRKATTRLNKANKSLTSAKLRRTRKAAGCGHSGACGCKRKSKTRKPWYK